jgi:hypothetical protein
MKRLSWITVSPSSSVLPDTTNFTVHLPSSCFRLGTYSALSLILGLVLVINPG